MQHDDAARWFPDLGDRCIDMPFSRRAACIACRSNTDALPQLRLHLAGLNAAPLVAHRARAVLKCGQ